MEETIADKSNSNTHATKRTLRNTSGPEHHELKTLGQQRIRKRVEVESDSDDNDENSLDRPETIVQSPKKSTEIMNKIGEYVACLKLYKTYIQQKLNEIQKDNRDTSKQVQSAYMVMDELNRKTQIYIPNENH